MSVRDDLDKGARVAGAAVLATPDDAAGTVAVRLEQESDLRAGIARDLGEVDELLDQVCLKA